MRHCWFVCLPLLLGLESVAAATLPQVSDSDLQALLAMGTCPRFLLPDECRHLRDILVQAPAGEREAILADVRAIMREREAACRCETAARPAADTPGR
ncbi:MAG: hypothetical protein ACK4TK_02270 [Thiobacillaceae bacterium]